MQRNGEIIDNCILKYGNDVQLNNFSWLVSDNFGKLVVLMKEM